MAERYVKVVAGDYEGRVGILCQVFTRSWLDYIRRCPKAAQVRDIEGRHWVSLLPVKNLKEISKKEYFEAKLRG